MNRDNDFDRLLATWLDDGAEVAPERFVWAAIDQVERTPQRGTWRLTLEGLIMRLQPVAPILGVAAVVIAAIALYVTFARPNVGVPESTATPIPIATMPAAESTTGEYVSSSFRVPFRLSMPAAASADGWQIAESTSMVTFAPAPGFGSLGLLLAASDTRIIDAAGRPAELPDDLAAWLEEQDGIDRSDVPADTAVRLQGLGIDVTARAVRLHPDSLGGRSVLQTVQGQVVPVPTESTFWWILRVPAQSGDLLLIYSEPRSAEALNWAGSFLQIAESLALR